MDYIDYLKILLGIFFLIAPTYFLFKELFKINGWKLLVYIFTISSLLTVIISKIILGPILLSYYPTEKGDFFYTFIGYSFFIAIFNVAFFTNLFSKQNKWKRTVYQIFFSISIVFLSLFLTVLKTKPEKKFSTNINDYKKIKIDSTKNITSGELFDYCKSSSNIMLNMSSSYINTINYTIENMDSTIISNHKTLREYKDTLDYILTKIKIEYERVKRVNYNKDSIVCQVQYVILNEWYNKRYAIVFQNNKVRKLVDVQKEPYSSSNYEYISKCMDNDSLFIPLNSLLYRYFTLSNVYHVYFIEPYEKLKQKKLEIEKIKQTEILN